jgi:hypothetical protein
MMRPIWWTVGLIALVLLGVSLLSDYWLAILSHWRA